MKKNLLIAISLMVISVVTSSCNQPVVTNYPENLIGFWASTPNEDQAWSGLEVKDATHATFITYEGNECIIAEEMQLTYSSTNGTGRLEGDGKMLQLKATSDTTITIQTIDGNIIFTKSAKPQEEFSLVGYWKEEAKGNATHLLFYPQNEQGETIATIITEKDGVLDGIMVQVASFDTNTLVGGITFLGGTGKEFAITASDLHHMNFNFGRDILLTKQARIENTPKNIVGIWKAETSIAGIMGGSMTIVVNENYMCDISYTRQTTTSTIKGTAKGKVHYCPRAGMGVMLPVEYNLGEELDAIFEGFECGIFNILSPTKISVSLASIGLTNDLIFTKQ